MSGSHEAVLTVGEAHSISLYEAYAESLESENAIALAAMTANLSQWFYRLRQKFDEEHFDIIAGFNALSTKTRLSRERVS
jgi:hypothetical protein